MLFQYTTQSLLSPLRRQGKNNRLLVSVTIGIKADWEETTIKDNNVFNKKI